MRTCENYLLICAIYNYYRFAELRRDSNEAR